LARQVEQQNPISGEEAQLERHALLAIDLMTVRKQLIDAMPLRK